MKIRKAYKFRLKPTIEQAQQLKRIAGHCRFLWNKVLSINLARLKNHQPLMWYHEADFWSKLWKSSNEYAFLKEVPAHCLQQKLKDLDKAFRDAFDKKQTGKRLPTWRKLKIHNSFRFPEPKHIQLDNRRVKLPKLGWISFFKSQSIQGELRNITISQSANYWYISFQVELEQVDAISQSMTAIGIDVGIEKFAALSDGKLIEPVSAFKKWQSRLAKKQKQLAKKQKQSQNFKKQVFRIQKVHRKIAEIRRDFLHKTSTQLSKNHALIVVEDLKITNMSRSAKGTVEEPGVNVKAKSGLNRSILDQGFAEFKRQLEYKQTWSGGLFIKVNPKYTSQRCSACSHTHKDNRINRSRFVCQNCQYSDHADINAAKNILAAGHAVLACGETGLPDSMKQEPLQNREKVAA